LRSALANLVRNAIDHGGGVARMAVRRAIDVIEIDVDDAGPGFTADDLPYVFQPFYKGRGDGGSLGLGLSLVDRIARAHGGKAIARNLDGRGARVTLKLPLLPDIGERTTVEADATGLVE
jgi:two-component system OmpR family sensor kinase